MSLRRSAAGAWGDRDSPGREDAIVTGMTQTNTNGLVLIVVR